MYPRSTQSQSQPLRCHKFTRRFSRIENFLLCPVRNSTLNRSRENLKSECTGFNCESNWYSEFEMDVERSSLCNCVVNFLLEENYLLSAFELLHELLDDGRDDQAIRLKEYFSDPSQFPPDQISRFNSLRGILPHICILSIYLSLSVCFFFFPSC